MIYKEVEKDLFAVSEDYCLAHCISADFALLDGIAVEFKKRFDVKKKLKSIPKETIPNWGATKGYCLKVDNVLNLVTKRWVWLRPTYKTLSNALIDMKRVCLENSIGKVAMPLIGCGIDGLKWEKVSTLIKELFEDTEIEILVCIKK